MGRRRRELFPPDRRLQALMALAAVLTPLVVLAAVGAALLFLPTRLRLGLLLAMAIGLVVAVRARSKAEDARPLPAAEAPGLHAIVDRLCALADLPRPRIYLDMEWQPNSWIVDPPGRPARLHVTSGLLDVLEGPELEAVVAHELAHVANRDATVMTVVGGPGAVLAEGGRRLGGSGGWWALQFGGLLAMVVGKLSTVGTNALSRYRELAADQGAVALTGRPSALASALLKVSGELARLPAEDLRVAAGRDAFHLLPIERELHRLFATHPPLRRRLAALERMEARLHAARPHPDVL